MRTGLRLSFERISLPCPFQNSIVGTVMKFNTLAKQCPRDKTLELVEDQRIDKDELITALLKYMSWDDVEDCIRINFDIDLSSDESED